MTAGPLLPNVLAFAVPLILSGMLQLLYNSADIIVVGRFADSVAMASVGATTSLIHLLVSLLMGLSVGASVAVARAAGAGDRDGVHRAVHTSMALAVLSGAALGVLLLVLSRPLLEMMGCPADVVGGAQLYLNIYAVGLPASLVYNYGAAILRAVGDTKRPLYYLTVSGLVNVVLNVALVAGLRLGVAGVAIATVVSETISAALVLASLIASHGDVRFEPKKTRIERRSLSMILRIGIPAGLQSSMFSISNVLIQSAINSFGSTVVAGNSAASNLEGFIYTGMNAFAQAAVTFTSQNVGARRYDNLDRVMRNCLLCVTVVGLFLGCGAYFGGEVLLHFYSTDEAVVAAGLSRMQIICTAYFLCGIMDTLASCLRGRGYSVIPMIVSLVGSCLLRLVWIATIFRMFRSTGTLYISYPISWALTAGVHLICLLVVRKKMNDQLKEETRLAA